MESTMARMMVMARMAITMRAEFLLDFLEDILLQLRFDSLCQIRPDAFDLSNFLSISSQDSFDGSKVLQQALRRSGPTPGMASSLEANPILPRRLRCAVIAKRCASSRMRWIRYSPCERSSRRIEYAPLWQEKFLFLLGQASHGEAAL